MRLIDADTLIKDLSYLYTKNHIPVDMRAKETLSTIMEQPTAYNADKVIEQLEKKIQTHECCMEYEKKNGTITEEFQQRKAVEVLKDAIEIVKAGGKE